MTCLVRSIDFNPSLPTPSICRLKLQSSRHVNKTDYVKEAVGRND